MKEFETTENKPVKKQGRNKKDLFSILEEAKKYSPNDRTLELIERTIQIAKRR